MKILFQDDKFVAVDKPAGFHVHPHEDPRNRVDRDKICLYQVRDMMGQHVYPVHRLDAGTSGVLLFALSSESARELCKLFAEKSSLKKTYKAVVRGYVKTEDMISVPLELDSTGNLVEAHTQYRRLQTMEFPVAVGNRFPTARYSLVEAKPLTGRFHQIRRHFCRISHPLLGDSTHGDSRHNQFFRNELGIEGLCLKAESLELVHPWSGQNIKITAPDSDKWNKIHLLFDSRNPLTPL
ncbi:tRNA pseudouridine synthase C [compost metagenome]